MDNRYLQAHREARWALVLTLLYLLGWVISAYCTPNATGITGLPLWFELSCLLLPLLFILLCCLAVRLFFHPVSLESPSYED